ncbi:MAG TPA: zinc-dependent metalloprotease [Pyrinomonadaceae bacterium]|nr:zinc-dependent metalloprotease [Pyrinomonadaceae bacterium]
MKNLSTALPLLAFITFTAAAQTRPAAETNRSLPSITEKVAGMQKFRGYFPFYWDGKAGKLWLEIDKWSTDFLYVESLPAGIGSNDIGLDRGQLGSTFIVRFERIGPRVLLIANNNAFRANSDNEDERRAVKDAFAESTLFGFEVSAEEGNRALVDATSFYLRDAHQIPNTLQRSQQGSFRLDPTRSALYLPNTKNFPKNTEVEATLTFGGEDPGPWIRQVVPVPQAITVREHHSFVELPPPGFKPRALDPRAGYFGISFMDFAMPISEPITKRYISRHRLQKKDPAAAISEAVEPIVYYVDRGAPEPVRSALIEGASWWNQAFEAIGYKNAFRVEVMPVDADPMDVRYNVIQWVHRSTRGWSYGSSVGDPRTGEIIQGRVSLGSLRDRQDFLIAEGLLAPYEKGKSQTAKIMEQVVLARLKQLAAHEVGHTLGLQHNYAASPTNRASVMDYPAPLARLGADGVPDLSEAYAKGIGEWDKVAINYGYQDFPAGTNESIALDEVLSKAFARGLMYLTDQDARPGGSSSSVAHLWDNGANALDGLSSMMKVRTAALKRFGENNIREGAPMATLEDVLVPLYMGHRYQVEAVAKLIGGEDYTFSMRGKGDKNPQIVSPDEQRRALAAVLETLEPEALALPESVLRLMPPRPPGYSRTREDFRIRTSPSFDALAPAEAVADHVCDFLFNPERAARLVEFHARDEKNPGLSEVMDRIISSTWKAAIGFAQAGRVSAGEIKRYPYSIGYESEIRRTVNMVVLVNLMTLAANERASNQARAIAELKLEELKSWLVAQRRLAGDVNQRAFLFYAAEQIKRFQSDPKKMNLTRPNDPPDGQPIGMDWWNQVGLHCDWN